jgi:hypothetical protein
MPLASIGIGLRLEVCARLARGLAALLQMHAKRVSSVPPWVHKPSAENRLSLARGTLDKRSTTARTGFCPPQPHFSLPLPASACLGGLAEPASPPAGLRRRSSARRGGTLGCAWSCARGRRRIASGIDHPSDSGGAGPPRMKRYEHGRFTKGKAARIGFCAPLAQPHLGSAGPSPLVISLPRRSSELPP